MFSTIIHFLFPLSLISDTQIGPDSLKTRVYCCYDTCKSESKWKINANTKDLQKVYNDQEGSVAFSIFHNEKCDHSGKLKVQIRGMERSEMKKVLASQTAENYIEEQLIYAKKTGEEVKIPSKKVAEKIRSDALCNQDFDKDSVKNLVALQKEIGYIQMVSAFPFQVIVCNTNFFPTLIDYKKKLRNRNDLRNTNFTGYLDATGNVCRQNEYANHAILYHCLATWVKVPNAISGKVLEVAGMLSDEQSQESIERFLLKFKRLVTCANLPWPFFSEIVSDESWANINAINTAWNNCSSIEYINKMYAVFNGQEDFDSKMTRVHSCLPHIQKNWSKSIEKVAIESKWEPQTASDVKRIFAIGFLLRNYVQYLDYFVKLVSIFCTQHNNDEIKAAYEWISSLSESEHITDFFEKCEQAEASLEITEDLEEEYFVIDQNQEMPQLPFPQSTKAMYKDSLFFKEAVEIYERVRIRTNTSVSSNIPNKMYAPKLLFLYMKRYISKLPLLINVQDEGICENYVYNNNNIECSFRVLKDELDNNKIELGSVPPPAGRLVSHLKKFNEQKISHLENKYCNRTTTIVNIKNPTKNLKKAKDDEETDNCTEQWRKGSRKRTLSTKPTYFQPKKLAKLGKFY